MRRVLIANRGEIALRAVRACRRAGLESVAVYTRADANAPHAWAADRAVCIGEGPAATSYLDAPTLLETARRTGCDAVYPGYGFLSENAAFAEQCRALGLTFVGPAPETIRLMGDKAAARRTAAGLGVPVVPGTPEGFTDAAAAAGAARGIGFPLLLKASGGGGGRGMRVVRAADELAACFAQASAEAQAAFGNPELYLERFFDRVRHVEVQVFGDAQGQVRHLWERDCSLQRRHQKLIEEAPSPALSPAQRRELTEAALAIARGVGYVNAGTVEFILDADSGRFFFIEMNTRIQVEHPVTEMLAGVDLVLEQLRVAAGAPLSFDPPPEPPPGAAIEWRICAEDAERDFRPSPGRIERWRPPVGDGLRLDGWVATGAVVPPFYDSMIAKLIVAGRDRAEALDRSALALAAFEVEGIATTIPLFRRLLAHPDFRQGSIHTRWMEEQFA